MLQGTRNGWPLAFWQSVWHVFGSRATPQPPELAMWHRVQRRSVRRSRCDPGPGTAHSIQSRERNLHGGEEGEEGGEEAGEEEEEGEEKLQWPLLKSRDPHLAGGEQTKQKMLQTTHQRR
jgi:hypothetical protein